MNMQRTIHQYVHWALTYPLPQPTMPYQDGFVYYSPFSHDTFQRGFLLTQTPLALDRLRSSRLVPATIQARVQLALEYHQHADGGVSMVWSAYGVTNADTGELITWYEEVALWGATSFHAREGKWGTVLARTREPLIAAALRHGYVPRVKSFAHVQQLPGMDNIHPVWLEQGDQRYDHLLACLQKHPVEAASDHQPFIALDHLPAEWLVTLLYRDHHLPLTYASPTLPTVAQVLWKLLSDANILERCRNEAEWTHMREDEGDLYELCVKQTQELKEMLGSAYADFQQAFQMAAGKEKEAWQQRC